MEEKRVKGGEGRKFSSERGERFLERGKGCEP